MSTMIVLHMAPLVGSGCGMDLCMIRRIQCIEHFFDRVITGIIGSSKYVYRISWQEKKTEICPQLIVVLTRGCRF